MTKAKGLVKVLYSVEPEQRRLLRLEAIRRSETTGKQPDASAVLREVLDVWAKKQARKEK